jgi:hypothetical protein
MSVQKTFTVLAAVTAVALALPAQASFINFDDQGLTGPSNFSQASPSPQTIDIASSSGNVRLEGGVILTNTSNLPANQTSIYGTANFGTGLSNPLTITFANNITNFLVDVLNGLSQTIRYEVSDGVNSSVFDLAPNLSSGATTIGFAAAGNVVTITSLTAPTTQWDFFVDNIRWNLAIDCGPTGCNPTVVPVPAALPLFLAGALGIAGFGFRSRRKQA